MTSSKKRNSPLYPSIKQIDDQRFIDGKLIGIVYLVTNKVNGKRYVGQTRRLFWKRWLEHLRVDRVIKLFRAIQRYGEFNFEINLLASSFNRDELDNQEKYWIAHYKSDNDDYGYNISAGGWSYEMPFEKRIKLSKYYVRCIETGEVFASLNDAAFSKGLSCGNVYQCVEKRPSFNTIGGYHWEAVDKTGFDVNKLVREIKQVRSEKKRHAAERNKYVHVKNTRTGQQWDRIAYLARDLGLGQNYTYLIKCINRKRPFRGELYEYVK